MTNIFEKWFKNVNIVNKNPHLKNYIKLYDQGVFIWTMRETGNIGDIHTDPKYNYPAKRNLYEYHENKFDYDYKWDNPHQQIQYLFEIKTKLFHLFKSIIYN